MPAGAPLELRCRAGSNAGHTDIGVGCRPFCLECALHLIIDTKLNDRRDELTCALVPLVRQSCRLERRAINYVQSALITALSKGEHASSSLQLAIIALGPLSTPNAEAVLTPSGLHGQREAKGLIATLNGACERHPETRQSVAVVLASKPELCAQAVRNLANDELEHAASIAFILGAAVQDDNISARCSGMCTKNIIASVKQSSAIVVGAMVQCKSSALRHNTLALLVLLCRNGHSADEEHTRHAFDALVHAQLVKVICRVLIDRVADLRHLATYLTQILLIANPHRSSVFRRACASERVGSYMIQGVCDDEGASTERDCEVLVLHTLLEMSVHESIVVSLHMLAKCLKRAMASCDLERAAIILTLIPRLRAEPELTNSLPKLVDRAARTTVLCAKMLSAPETASSSQVTSIVNAGIRAILHLLPACTQENSCLSNTARATRSKNMPMPWASTTLEAVEHCIQFDCIAGADFSSLRCFEQLAILCCRWWPKGVTEDEPLACTCYALRDALLQTLDNHIVPHMAARVDMDASLAAAFIRTVRTGLNLECPSLSLPSCRIRTESKFSVVRTACAGLPHFVLQILVQFCDTSSNDEQPLNVVSEGTAILVDLLAQSGLCGTCNIADEVTAVVESLRHTSDASTLIVGLARLLDREFTCTLLALLYLCVCVEDYASSSPSAGGLYTSIATYSEEHREALCRLPECSLLLFVQLCSVITAPYFGGRPLPKRAQRSVSEAILSRPSIMVCVLEALHKPSLIISCPTAVLQYLVRQHLLATNFCALAQDMLATSVPVSLAKVSVHQFGALLTNEPEGYKILAELIKTCQEDRLQSTLGFVLNCVLSNTAAETDTAGASVPTEAKAVLADAVIMMLEQLTQPAQACSAFVLLALLLRIARVLLSAAISSDRAIARYCNSLSRVLSRCDTRRQPICTVPFDMLHAATHLSHTIVDKVVSHEEENDSRHSISAASLHAAARFTMDVLQQSALPFSIRAAATSVASGLFLHRARGHDSAPAESSECHKTAVSILNATIDMLISTKISSACRCVALIGAEAVLHCCTTCSLFYSLDNIWCPLLYYASCAFCDDIAAQHEPLLRHCAARCFIRMYELAVAAQQHGNGRGQNSMLLRQLKQYGWLRFITVQALRTRTLDKPALEILSLVTLLKPPWINATFRGKAGGAGHILSMLEHIVTCNSSINNASCVQLSCAILYRLAQQGILELELVERAEEVASGYLHKNTKVSGTNSCGSHFTGSLTQVEDIRGTTDSETIVIPAQSNSQCSVAISSWLPPSCLLTACDDSIRPPAQLPLCTALRAVTAHG